MEEGSHRVAMRVGIASGTSRPRGRVGRFGAKPAKTICRLNLTPAADNARPLNIEYH